jgi:hypothetical protein
MAQNFVHPDMEECATGLQSQPIAVGPAFRTLRFVLSRDIDAKAEYKYITLIKAFYDL